MHINMFHNAALSEYCSTLYISTDPIQSLLMGSQLEIA